MLPIEQLHPVAVHFPIVFFLTLAALDIVFLARGNAISGRSCTGNLSAGLAILAGLAAVVAYIFGDIAYDVALSSGVPESELETHQGLGTVTAAALVVWALLRGFAWWRGHTLSGRLKSGVVLLEIAGALLIIVTAYFGGQLVYELGVNTG